MISKKSFTLIELLIVAVIIWLIILATMWLAWNYLIRTQIRADAEQFQTAFQTSQSKALSTNVYNWIQYRRLEVSLSPWQSRFSIEATSSGSSVLLDTFPFIASEFSGVFLDTTHYSSWKVLLETYKIGCSFVTPSNVVIQTWTVYFDIKQSKGWNIKYCFRLPLVSCKLTQYDCK